MLSKLQSYAQPNLITESTNRLEYTYGADEQRIKAITKVNNAITNTRYYFGDYEKDITNGVTKHIYYISAGVGLVAIALRENNINTFHYAYTDHLGSIVALTDNAGTITSEQNFDAWGRRRNPTNWTYAGIPAVQTWLKRGYTGHEHLSQFGLINMNGRMYDPVVGRMLSTDNFVQSPDNTQSYNRYSYALNNPLKYTDPSGEFVIIDSYLRGLFKGGFKEANRFAGNDAKIWAGLYVSDNNKTFFGQVLEIASRLTYQLPQTVGGLITAHVSNTILGNVNFVRYEHGATVVQTSQKNTGSAVTQGSYIVGGSKLEADANNPLFQHEYGHYLQSQSMGWAYYPRIGIPSLLSASGSGDHDFNKVEQDANRRAFLYFNKNVDGFYEPSLSIYSDDYNKNQGWDFFRNPLNVNKTRIDGQFVDYKSSSGLQSLNNIRIRARWYDHASWLLFPIGPIAIGLLNSR